MSCGGPATEWLRRIQATAAEQQAVARRIQATSRRLQAEAAQLRAAALALLGERGAAPSKKRRLPTSHL